MELALASADEHQRGGRLHVHLHLGARETRAHKCPRKQTEQGPAFIFLVVVCCSSFFCAHQQRADVVREVTLQAVREQIHIADAVDALATLGVGGLDPAQKHQVQVFWSHSVSGTDRETDKDKGSPRKR